MVKYKLVVTPKAIIEIQDAIDYYNSKKESLGRRFFDEMERQLNAISKNPQYRSIRYDSIRMARFNKFPYAIHYEIQQEKIIVNAVLCDYRNRNK